MLKKLLSYFIPINIYKKRSAVSRSIEITWNNGELVLDSENTNYSFGSLQRILRKGLFAIGPNTIRDMNEILILGVAAGSVIHTLMKELKFTGKITGVEIDPEIIEIANQYFHLDKMRNVEIILDDAFEFVLKTNKKYDLIIVDIFQDIKMPSFLFEDYFAKRLCFLLTDGGFLLFNTMILCDADNERNKQYLTYFDAVDYDVWALPRVEQHNELIIVKKQLKSNASA
ncbi:MAG TPA: fused MFS/spermidine synthase [Flavobacterium sp.]|jgi:spermidine synthase